MKKYLFTALITISLCCLVVITLFKKNTIPTETNDISRFQQQVQTKAAQLEILNEKAFQQINWVRRLEVISKKHDLNILIKESNLLQVELSVDVAPYNSYVDAFAELYAQGIRFQSIRLLKTDTPGMVRADTIRLINSN